ncbi:unnamed protein product, partial [Mesorhabditis spiculigera]
MLRFRIPLRQVVAQRGVAQFVGTPRKVAPAQARHVDDLFTHEPLFSGVVGATIFISLGLMATFLDDNWFGKLIRRFPTLKTLQTTMNPDAGWSRSPK